MKNLKNPVFIIGAIAFLVVVGLAWKYIVAIEKQKAPTLAEQKLHCLELGSDARAAACLKLISDSSTRKCSFSLEDIQIHGGNYEGIIKNQSDNTDHLKAMIAKIYSSDGLLLGDGYASIGEDLAPGKSIGFTIHTFANIQDVETEPDIYPWFTTCE